MLELENQDDFSNTESNSAVLQEYVSAPVTQARYLLEELARDPKYPGGENAERTALKRIAEAVISLGAKAKTNFEAIRMQLLEDERAHNEHRRAEHNSVEQERLERERADKEVKRARKVAEREQTRLERERVSLQEEFAAELSELEAVNKNIEAAVEAEVKSLEDALAKQVEALCAERDAEKSARAQQNTEDLAAVDEAIYSAEQNFKELELSFQRDVELAKTAVTESSSAVATAQASLAVLQDELNDAYTSAKKAQIELKAGEATLEAQRRSLEKEAAGEEEAIFNLDEELKTAYTELKNMQEDEIEVQRNKIRHQTLAIEESFAKEVQQVENKHNNKLIEVAEEEKALDVKFERLEENEANLLEDQAAADTKQTQIEIMHLAELEAESELKLANERELNQQELKAKDELELYANDVESVREQQRQSLKDSKEAAEQEEQLRKSEFQDINTRLELSKDRLHALSIKLSEEAITSEQLVGHAESLLAGAQQNLVAGHAAWMDVEAGLKDKRDAQTRRVDELIETMRLQCAADDDELEQRKSDRQAEYAAVDKNEAHFTAEVNVEREEIELWYHAECERLTHDAKLEKDRLHKELTQLKESRCQREAYEDERSTQLREATDAIKICEEKLQEVGGILKKQSVAFDERFASMGLQRKQRDEAIRAHISELQSDLQTTTLADNNLLLLELEALQNLASARQAALKESIACAQTRLSFEQEKLHDCLNRSVEQPSSTVIQVEQRLLENKQEIEIRIQAAKQLESDSRENDVTQCGQRAYRVIEEMNLQSICVQQEFVSALSAAQDSEEHYNIQQLNTAKQQSVVALLQKEVNYLVEQYELMRDRDEKQINDFKVTQEAFLSTKTLHREEHIKFETCLGDNIAEICRAAQAAQLQSWEKAKVSTSIQLPEFRKEVDQLAEFLVEQDSAFEEQCAAMEKEYNRMLRKNELGEQECMQLSVVKQREVDDAKVSRVRDLEKRVADETSLFKSAREDIDTKVKGDEDWDENVRKKRAKEMGLPVEQAAAEVHLIDSRFQEAKQRWEIEERPALEKAIAEAKTSLLDTQKTREELLRSLKTELEMQTSEVEKTESILAETISLHSAAKQAADLMIAEEETKLTKFLTEQDENVRNKRQYIADELQNLQVLHAERQARLCDLHRIAQQERLELHKQEAARLRDRAVELRTVRSGLEQKKLELRALGEENELTFSQGVTKCGAMKTRNLEEIKQLESAVASNEVANTSRLQEVAREHTATIQRRREGLRDIRAKHARELEESTSRLLQLAAQLEEAEMRVPSAEAVFKKGTELLDQAKEHLTACQKVVNETLPVREKRERSEHSRELARLKEERAAIEHETAVAVQDVLASWDAKLSKVKAEAHRKISTCTAAATAKLDDARAKLNARREKVNSLLAEELAALHTEVVAALKEERRVVEDTERLAAERQAVRKNAAEEQARSRARTLEQLYAESHTLDLEMETLAQDMDSALAAWELREAELMKEETVRQAEQLETERLRMQAEMDKEREQMHAEIATQIAAEREARESAQREYEAQQRRLKAKLEAQAAAEAANLAADMARMEAERLALLAEVAGRDSEQGEEELNMLLGVYNARAPSPRVEGLRSEIEASRERQKCEIDEQKQAELQLFEAEKAQLLAQMRQMEDELSAIDETFLR
mmetsp:Transcript_16476/g.56109  ORF Transcript_16476/g.56109 Transcript_16476/m.56109 type:complete len:1666 (-) Transcript_16476:379-5376(-)|eukprot:CAMPEP_0183801130 /NCGR_PEP_ID=MMETSP0803_2-20130417/26905_1 /TAXON_ID=195967 /ORGANISM="Crustomastix stigmata, Strain CCMP3273" /LENGTH=1665 /DNA_ID=CAMNT_0026045847 /DNA_START=146 /DNA_END=5143 /DNA_ORIENTATION=-